MHTPGPWEIDPGHPGVYEVARTDTFTTTDAEGNEHVSRHGLIALVYEPCGGHETQPNARLIAASPDLLERIKALVAATEDNDRIGDYGVSSYANEVVAAKAAIAQAEGR